MVSYETCELVFILHLAVKSKFPAYPVAGSLRLCTVLSTGTTLTLTRSSALPRTLCASRQARLDVAHTKQAESEGGRQQALKAVQEAWKQIDDLRAEARHA